MGVNEERVGDSDSPGFPKEIVDVLDRISRIRAEKGVTYRSIQDRVGLSSTYVHNVLSYKKMPTLGTLLKIAQALEVPLSSFFIAEPATKASEKPEHPSSLLRKP